MPPRWHFHIHSHLLLFGLFLFYPSRHAWSSVAEAAPTTRRFANVRKWPFSLRSLEIITEPIVSFIREEEEDDDDEDEDAPVPSNEPSSCPPVLPEHRIVGGERSSIPFLAALWDVSTGIPVFRCSATQLSASWLLSSAHCNVTAGNWVAIVGGSDATEGPRRRVLQFYKHNKADLALVNIEQLELENVRAYATVNSANHLPLTNAYARTAGFGFTNSSESGSGDMNQHSVDIPVASADECENAYGADILHTNRQLMCAGKDGCDSCLGDSGGPLFQFDINNRAVVVGVVTAGEGCGEPGYPGVYTKVSEAIKWMQSIGAEFELSSSPQQVFTGSEPLPDGQDNQKPPPVSSNSSATPEPQQQQKEDDDPGKEESKDDGVQVGRDTAVTLVAVAAVAAFFVFAGAFFGWWRWQRM